LQEIRGSGILPKRPENFPAPAITVPESAPFLLSTRFCSGSDNWGEEREKNWSEHALNVDQRRGASPSDRRALSLPESFHVTMLPEFLFPQTMLTGAAPLPPTLENRLQDTARILAEDVPGFVSLYLVQPDPPETHFLPRCGLVLIARKALRLSTRFALRAALARHLDGPQVELLDLAVEDLPAVLEQHRAGFDLVQGGKLLAGIEVREDLPKGLCVGPALRAAEKNLSGAWEVLLRSYPEPQLLVREDLLPPPAVESTLRLALKDVARRLADSLLLASGDYSVDGKKRKEILAAKRIEDPLERKLVDWAMEPDLSTPPPLQGKILPLWKELRRCLLGNLRRFVEDRTRRKARKPRVLRDRTHPTPKSKTARLLQAFRGRMPDWEEEYRNLLLGLILAKGDDKVDRILCRDAWQTLSNLGGPILAHPEWLHLRREALLLRPVDLPIPEPAIAEA